MKQFISLLAFIAGMRLVLGAKTHTQVIYDNVLDSKAFNGQIVGFRSPVNGRWLRMNRGWIDTSNPGNILANGDLWKRWKVVSSGHWRCA